mmetsp:Transcript_106840/g.309044  ORF Transcript_106840/g.309044 Transcript_106840/m.309044 type:complete len:200 (+) Transcript_106840:403-1002(+)
MLPDASGNDGLALDDHAASAVNLDPSVAALAKAACAAAWKRSQALANGAPPLRCVETIDARNKSRNSCCLVTSMARALIAAETSASRSDSLVTCRETWNGLKSTAGAQSPGARVYSNLPLQPSPFSAASNCRISSRGGLPVAFQERTAFSMMGKTLLSNAACGMCCISLTYKIAVVPLEEGTHLLVSAIYCSGADCPRK